MLKKISKQFTILTLILLIVFSFSGCTNKTQTTSNNYKTITDQAGREVKIPEKIEKIYCTSPLGSVFIYSLSPEKLVAWNNKIPKKSLRYLNEDVAKLPVAGSLQGKKSGNIEEISKLKPDIVISMGDINDLTISGVEKFQKQSNIPFILVDGKMDKLPEAYKFVGNLLNKKEKARELALYCEKILKSSKEITNNIKEDKKIKVYYAEGPKGLETDPEGSLHSEVITYAGGRNVANFPVKHGSRNTVSMEQIISWNPDVIVSDSNAFNDSSWKQVSAVKQNKIYIIPTIPFNWFDKPPSINRLIGIRWFQACLYPDLYKGDINKDTKEFFKLFYHKDLSHEEVNDLLKTNISK
ncbi:ABC transporter substrate-binding protein [Clostridium sporogenes]|uniref:ABC transporter substrate-binding protein n=1 Tax=Clostridium sporogenes TaxID=1509 RepID=UPI0022388AD3|nr:ABC transporter substrate-binding protein [Clostridium sporogenes]EKS4343083.1 ABC transporter substrate-binding protein [Clostridium botulinum]EKS4393547.1 ABC transporter substrate-binding protein [Clostridium botulinum]MCW6078722.1 ABC transporter substrate-binding protein [Clostridium sporogenes]